MFNVYHSNQLDVQKSLLINLMQRTPLADPLQSEIILVQSPGMAQWLQLGIAEQIGIAANLNFPMPASFIWQQYVETLPNIAQQSQFSKDAMTWRLMVLIPDFLEQDEFTPLKHYLQQANQSAQQKLYQLARTIADLFDQYLVYRPDWIQAWEQQDETLVLQQIQNQLPQQNEQLVKQIERDIAWQAVLWRALVAKASQTTQGIIQHRAGLHRQYIETLQRTCPSSLPTRIFIFGISALPKAYLETFKAISQHCDVHLFFNNPSYEYWGDIVDPSYLQKLALRQRTEQVSGERKELFSPAQLSQLAQQQFELTAEQERLQIGHPLLAMWGKLGRDFLYLLTDFEPDHEINAFVPAQVEPCLSGPLLTQIQQRILALKPSHKGALLVEPKDNSLALHCCHSEMREVEVLHDYLLGLFQQDASLTPKDIVVMVADIDKYTPYIQAVFGKYQTAHRHNHIPFSISDNKLSASDTLVSAFLRLLALYDSDFSAESILAFLDVPAIRTHFSITLNDLSTLRQWVADAGIRFGLFKQTASEPNYNAWQAGLERMLLGYAMTEQNGIWQDNLGFDPSYGLQGKLAGFLANFIARLAQWQQVSEQSYAIEQWQHHLLTLVDDFFALDEQSIDAILHIKNTIQQLTEQLQEIEFTTPLSIQVIAESLAETLDESKANLKFLVGKVNFCTLLPMRAIPFKVVCLLGMNEGDYPRHHTPNSFDLMQYQRQKGDRFRRDDDRYLFLEALLAAENHFYLSYIGRSIIDNSLLEPSILVSQLLDYLAENATQLPIAVDEQGEPNDKLNPFVQYHPMTAFSPSNFQGHTSSFAQEWLPLLDKSQHQLADFIQPLDEQSAPLDKIDIELSQLVQFVQNPVRFFFEKRLGVYFSATDELIPDAENFDLDSLQLYHLYEDFLPVEPDESRQFFAKLHLKGVLPQGQFGQLYSQKVQREISEFKQAIGDYLQQPSQTEYAQLVLDKAVLQGSINHLFGEQKQRITWRVGKVNDKFIIENWLYYLYQLATLGNVPAPLFFGRDGKAHSFKELDQTTAIEQLNIYVQSYLQGLQQLQLVPTKDIEKYLKLLAKDADNQQAQSQHLNLIAQGSDYSMGDSYWQRVLQQSQGLDLTTINQQTLDWFNLMFAHLTKA